MGDEFNYVLGQRLRAARRQRGWSLGDVEQNTAGEFKASVVGAYERGERAISVHRFVRLAEAYATSAPDLLPAPPDPDLVIDLDALNDDNGDLVDRYLAAIPDDATPKQRRRGEGVRSRCDQFSHSERQDCTRSIEFWPSPAQLVEWTLRPIVT